MNRKSFIKRVSLSAAAVVLGPSVLIASSKSKEEVDNAFVGNNIIESLGNGWEIDDSIESTVWCPRAFADEIIEERDMGGGIGMTLMTMTRKGKHTEGTVEIYTNMNIERPNPKYKMKEKEIIYSKIPYYIRK